MYTQAHMCAARYCRRAFVNSNISFSFIGIQTLWTEAEEEAQFRTFEALQSGSDLLSVAQTVTEVLLSKVSKLVAFTSHCIHMLTDVNVKNCQQIYIYLGDIDWAEYTCLLRSMKSCCQAYQLEDEDTARKQKIWLITWYRIGKKNNLSANAPKQSYSSEVHLL